MFSKLRFLIAFCVFIFALPSYADDPLRWAIPKPVNTEFTVATTNAVPVLRAVPDSINNDNVLLKAFPAPAQVPTPYIVGGTTASRNAFPEYTLLLVDGLDGFLYFLCGSSLISSNKVLTAAHCTIEFPAYRLYAIPAYYANSDPENVNVIHSVSKVIEHSKFSYENVDADISIITLSTSSGKTKAKVFGGPHQLAGYRATVVGVGLTSTSGTSVANILRRANISVASFNQCNAIWGPYATITDNMLCAGGASSGGIGACQGDSGGPLFATVEGIKTQIGIVSWGNAECGQAYVYDVFARTSAMIDFVTQHAPQTEVINTSTPTLAPIQLLLLL